MIGNELAQLPNKCLIIALFSYRVFLKIYCYVLSSLASCSYRQGLTLVRASFL